MASVSSYEKKARNEIDLFKNPPKGALARVAERIGNTAAGQAVAGAAKAAVEFVEPLTEPAAQAVGKATKGILDIFNDGASWSVRTSAILEEFRRDGHSSVQSLADIRALDLEAVDKTVGYLGAKYKSLAAATGAGGGAMGLPGMIAEIPVFVGLSLRAISEYATYYGFDVTNQGERAFALQVLTAASASTAGEKYLALAELSRTATALSARKTWEELNKMAFVQLAQQVAKMLGLKLTKKTLSAALPVVGGVIGAGMNAWFVSSITESAFMLYRERFLIEKYGVEAAVAAREPE